MARSKNVSGIVRPTAFAVFRLTAYRCCRKSLREVHENSKNLPAGANPSKRHLADRGIMSTFREEAEVRRSIPEQTMSLMQAQRHEKKYLNSTLLKSSKDLGWSTLFAESPLA